MSKIEYIPIQYFKQILHHKLSFSDSISLPNDAPVIEIDNFLYLECQSK